MPTMPSLPSSVRRPALWSKMQALRTMACGVAAACVTASSSSSSSGSSSPQLSSSRVSWRVSMVGKRPRVNSSQRRDLLTPTSLLLEGSSDLADYELLEVLGRGTFGLVRLARHRDTGRAVAIKILDKRQLVAMRQETNILREQSVHLRLEHPFIGRLFTTFQDTKAVYFVMEYCPGGELYGLVYGEDRELEVESSGISSSSSKGENSSTTDSHHHTGSRLTREENNEEEEENNSGDDTCATESESDGDHDPKDTASTASNQDEPDDEDKPSSLPRRKRSDSLVNRHAKRALRGPYGGLREPHVAFYLACLVRALEFLHDEQNVLYRDLKLENLVLDERGYPRLIDFGLSKPDAVAVGPRHTTICGSREYMAPELIRREAYGPAAEVWAFGVVMYELLFGVTAFYHPNHREQSRRITEDAVVFPAGAAEEFPEACALIRRLLAKDPSERPSSFREIREHAFFRRFFPTAKSWKQLACRQLRAPFVPTLSGPFDTSLFMNAYDEEDDDELVF